MVAVQAVGTGQLGQDSRDRTAGTKKPGRDGRVRTALTGRLVQDSQNTSDWTSWFALQDRSSQKRWRGQNGQDIKMSEKSIFSRNARFLNKDLQTNLYESKNFHEHFRRNVGKTKISGFFIFANDQRYMYLFRYSVYVCRYVLTDEYNLSYP